MIHKTPDVIRHIEFSDDSRFLTTYRCIPQEPSPHIHLETGEVTQKAHPENTAVDQLANSATLPFTDVRATFNDGSNGTLTLEYQKQSKKLSIPYFSKKPFALGLGNRVATVSACIVPHSGLFFENMTVRNYKTEAELCSLNLVNENISALRFVPGENLLIFVSRTGTDKDTVRILRVPMPKEAQK